MKAKMHNEGGLTLAINNVCIYIVSVSDTGYLTNKSGKKSPAWFGNWKFAGLSFIFMVVVCVAPRFFYTKIYSNDDVSLWAFLVDDLLCLW